MIKLPLLHLYLNHSDKSYIVFIVDTTSMFWDGSSSK